MPAESVVAAGCGLRGDHVHARSVRSREPTHRDRQEAAALRESTVKRSPESSVASARAWLLVIASWQGKIC